MMTGDGGHLHAAKQLLLKFTQPILGGDAKAKAAAQRSPAGWPVSRADLAEQIQQRLGGKLPAQLETSYCGPAAFLYCLIQDRPDIYTAYAIALWQQGHFFLGNARAAVAVNSKHGVVPAASGLAKAFPGASRRGHINDLDWMTMSCLSASTRPFNFTAVKPDDQFGSITFPWVMRRWFTAASAALRAETMGLGAFQSGLLETLSLLRYWSNSWIVLQVDATIIEGGDPDFFRNRHWVVVDPRKHPLAYKQPGNSPMPLEQVADEIIKAATQKMKDGGGIETADEGQIADVLSGTSVADWKTDIGFVSWADPHNDLTLGKIGRLIGRVYGGFAFSRFK